MLKWPDRATVVAALRRWVEHAVLGREDVLRIGYFGSYARGDAGVGSDLDLVIVLADSPEPFESRAAHWDATELPVPADVLVYTRREWEALDRRGRFGQTLAKEAIWLYRRDGP